MKILKKLTSVLLCLTVFFGAFSITTASAAEVATGDEVGASVATDDEVGASVSDDSEVGTKVTTGYGIYAYDSYSNSDISTLNGKSVPTSFYNTSFNSSSAIYGEGVCLEQEYKSPTYYNNPSKNYVYGSYFKYTDSEFDVMRTVAYYYYVATNVKAFTYNGTKYTFSGYVTALCKEYEISTTDCVTLFYRYTLYWLYAELTDSTTSWTYKSGVTSNAKSIVYDIEDTLKSLTGNVPDYFTCYIFVPSGTDEDGDPFQILFVVPKVKIALQKTASDTYGITTGNSCYSLENARYYIYADASCSQHIKMSDGSNAWIGTDSSGYGVLVSDSYLAAGCTTLYCKEDKAPTGYKTDSKSHQFVDNGKTFTLHGASYRLLEANVTDDPVSDPISGSIITKQGSDGNSLAGAQFTVKYYDGYYTSSNVSSKTAKCTWVFKTGSDGKIYFNSAHKVSGPSLYYNEDGDEAYPLGTITVQEYKAPTGYAIDSTLYVCQITQSGNNAVQSWSPSTADVSNDNLTVTDNKYIKLQLLKTSSNPDMTDGNSNYSLAGAIYYVYTNSSCTGTAVGSITTGSNGYGWCGSADGCKNTDDGDKGTTYYNQYSGAKIELKAGVTYYCKEVTAPTGYATSRTIYKFVDSGKTDSGGWAIYRPTALNSSTVTTIEETPKPGDVTLTKKDSSTKDILTGSQWQLYTSDGTLVHMVMKGVTGSYRYSTSGSFTVIETNSSGVLTVDNLPYGSYYFKEYKAPDGYQISTKNYTFTVTATTSSVSKIAYNSTTSGNVTLQKETGTGGSLSGSEWQLFTSSGVPIITIQNGNGTYMYSTADSTGEATTMKTSTITDIGNLFVTKLPKGDYYFIETTAPNGYMPYGKKLEFSITSSGTQTLGVDLEVIDNKIMLAETGAGGALPFYAAGAGFAALAAVFIIYHFKSKKRKENAK